MERAKVDEWAELHLTVARLRDENARLREALEKQHNATVTFPEQVEAKRLALRGGRE